MVGVDPDDALVVGADVGGTSTRVLVATVDGLRRGSGRSSGGNPISVPATQAAGAMASAVSDALQGLDPAAVTAVVVGLAGGRALNDPVIGDQFAQAWIRSGVRCVPLVVSDLQVAFSSATPESDGTVLLAGTGAVAGAICDYTLTRTVDGYGWLLGDVGSGFWLGREGVRRTLARLDSQLPLGALGEGILTAVLGRDHAGTSTEMLHGLIWEVNSRPPAHLAGLARVVDNSAGQGDEGAQEIIERAAEALVRSLGRVRDPADTTPLVVAGAVLGRDSGVGQSVRRRLSQQFAGHVLTTSDGVAGAAWLAARSVLDDRERALAAHKRLTTVTG